MKKLAIVFSVLLVVMTGCKKVESDLDVNTDPHFVNVGVELQMAKKSASSITHNYNANGYHIGITGALVDGDKVYDDVDLNNWSLSVEVTGDIYISVWHDDFDGTRVLETAYYGVEEQRLPTSTNDNVSAKVHLMQGFTIIETLNGAESLVESASINTKEVELNKYYYTASDVDVLISTTKGVLEGSHKTELGKGIKYVIKPTGGNVNIEQLPIFDDATDGDLVVKGDEVEVTHGLSLKSGDGNFYNVSAYKISEGTTESELSGMILNSEVSHVNVYLKGGESKLLEPIENGTSLNDILVNAGVSISDLSPIYYELMHSDENGNGRKKLYNLNIKVVYKNAIERGVDATHDLYFKSTDGNSYDVSVYKLSSNVSEKELSSTILKGDILKIDIYHGDKERMSVYLDEGASLSDVLEEAGLSVADLRQKYYENLFKEGSKLPFPYNLNIKVVYNN